jgi:hypothetical protein
VHGFRRDGNVDDAESLLDVRRRHGQFSNDDERHDHDDLQYDDGHVQGRNDQGGHVRHVHQRGCQLLQDDPGLLCVHDDHDGSWLHVLYVHEQYTRLLRLFQVIDNLLIRIKKLVCKWRASLLFGSQLLFFLPKA